MLMRKNKKSFFMILLVPLLILLLMAVKPASAYLFGQKIILESIPIDPRDLFYGDYINVNLAITEIPLDKVNEDLRQELKGFEDNTRHSPITVYTILKQHEDIYTVEEVRLTKPEAGLYMKGKVHYYSAEYDSSLMVDYQLNRCYVEENTGKQLEKIAQEGKGFISIKVMNGYALLDEVILP